MAIKRLNCFKVFCQIRADTSEKLIYVAGRIFQVNFDLELGTAVEIFFQNLFGSPLLLYSSSSKNVLLADAINLPTLFLSLLAVAQCSGSPVCLAFFNARSLSLISSKSSLVIQGSLLEGTLKFLIGHI